jgi:NADPH-dependent ferric siderophore reductase
MKKLLGIFLIAASFGAFAAPLSVGDALPAINLKDQYEQAFVVPADVQVILFAAEKGTSELMTKTLETLPSGTLKDKKAVYIADISGMPGFITKMVALPRMQKLEYLIALVRDAKDAEYLPRESAKVTVIKVQQGKVSSIEYVSDMSQLSQLLK